MPHEAVVPQQIDDVRWGHVEVDMLQIQQSGKPHTSFHVTSLNNNISIISVTSQSMTVNIIMPVSYTHLTLPTKRIV